MRKKICIALMAAFTVLLGVSSYFIIDHYREAEHQEQMYDSLVQLVEDSETEPVEPIIYSEDKTILPELTELYRQTMIWSAGFAWRIRISIIPLCRRLIIRTTIEAWI